MQPEVRADIISLAKYRFERSKQSFEASKRPGVNLDKNQISHIERTLMFGRTINFLTDWGIYLLAAIITAGYLIKDYLPD